MSNQPTRVRYYERQFLRTRDLTDEQAYHLEMRRRHNLALHSWGIAYGLTLTPDATGVNLTAGVAIDGFGRELVQSLPARVPQIDSQINQGPWDVWLNYGLAADDGASSNGACDAGANQSARQIERPNISVTLTAARPNYDPSQPPGVDPSNLDFSPERPPPDDISQVWPVFLGKIDWAASPTDPTGSPGWQVDVSQRRYAGLIAERIVGPPATGAPGLNPSPQQTLIQNGSEAALAPYPFAVYVWPAGQPRDEAQPSLAVDGDQNLWLRASSTTLNGDLVLTAGSALKFEANPIPPTNETESPGQPWRIYHHFIPAPSPPPASASSPTTPAPANGRSTPPPVNADADGYSDELRIAMAAEPNGTNQVAIGFWSDKGKFAPILTVGDNGDVTVNGNLIVNGGFEGRQINAPLSALGAGATAVSGQPITSDDPLTSLINWVGDEPSRINAVLAYLLAPTGTSPTRNQAVAEYLLGGALSGTPAFDKSIKAAKQSLQPDAFKQMQGSLAALAVTYAADSLFTKLIAAPDAFTAPRIKALAPTLFAADQGSGMSDILGVALDPAADSAMLQQFVKTLVSQLLIPGGTDSAFAGRQQHFINQLVAQFPDAGMDVSAVEQAFQPFTNALVGADTAGTGPSGLRGKATASTFFDDPNAQVPQGANTAGIDAIARSLAENCKVTPGAAPKSRVAAFINYLTGADPSKRPDLVDLLEALRILTLVPSPPTTPSHT